MRPRLDLIEGGRGDADLGADGERLIATIGRGRAASVRIRIRPFDGRDYLDLRIFESESATRKGITLRVDELEQVEQAIARARALLAGGRRGP
jgi:hypothetical protein